MQALDAILASVRLESTLLSRARYTAPWAVTTRGASAPIFHAVVAGQCVLTHRGGRYELSVGEVALLPRADAHLMSSGEATPVPVTNLSAVARHGLIGLIEHGGRGAETRIICGIVRPGLEAAAWLLEMLPPLIISRPTDPSARGWIDHTLGMLDAELCAPSPGSEAIVARLTDGLVLHILREHALSAAEHERGWLAALRDERIGKALALIHAEPGKPWTGSSLAAKVGMSRSRFFAHFTALVGEPPVHYLARWRASAAADLLRRRRLTDAALAEAVGYRSEHAFKTAFRRFLGVTPSTYRRQIREAP
jgi:AraC-like DNA-binding protein